MTIQVFPRVAAWLLLLLACLPTRAQTLQILPDVGAGFATVVDREHLFIENQTWPLNEIWLGVGVKDAQGNWNDLTHLATLSFSNHAVVAVGGLGRLSILGPGKVYVVARVGTLTSEPFAISIETPALTSMELLVYGRGGNPESVPGDQVRSGVDRFLTQLSQLGVPMQAYGPTTSYASFADDNSFENILGDHRSWLGTDLGQFREPGIRRSDTANFAYFAHPTVILTHAACQAAANDELITPGGVITAHGKTILNELFHTIVYQNDVLDGTDLTDDKEAEAEEQFSSEIPEIIEKVAEAHQIIHLQNRTNLDLVRLRQLLTNIRVKMQQLFNDYPDLFDQIMDAIGLEDNLDHGGGGTGGGGNWIPDGLDDDLLDHGLDYDTLPTQIDPPGGGGCGGGPMIGIEGGSKSHRLHDPVAVVVDDCGITWFVSRDDTGHLVLSPGPSR